MYFLLKTNYALLNVSVKVRPHLSPKLYSDRKRSVPNCCTIVVLGSNNLAVWVTSSIVMFV